MNVALLYATTFGHTKRVLTRFRMQIDIPGEAFQVPILSSAIESYDSFIFFCPTYGDEELHPDFEKFLVNLSLRNKTYALCELGNYYGYDDLQFGPARIIRPYLAKLGWQEFCPLLSLDSLPKINWPALDEWISIMKIAIKPCTTKLL
jgi:flavodoxin